MGRITLILTLPADHSYYSSAFGTRCWGGELSLYESRIQA